MTCARLQSLGPVNFLVDVKRISVRMIAWISEFGVLLDVLSFQKGFPHAYTHICRMCNYITHSYKAFICTMILLLLLLLLLLLF